MEIDDDKLYKLQEVIGLGTDCVTGPGLMIGSNLKQAIVQAGLKVENVKFECMEK